MFRNLHTSFRRTNHHKLAKASIGVGKGSSSSFQDPFPHSLWNSALKAASAGGVGYFAAMFAFSSLGGAPMTVDLMGRSVPWAMALGGGVGLGSLANDAIHYVMNDTLDNSHGRLGRFLPLLSAAGATVALLMFSGVPISALGQSGVSLSGVKIGAIAAGSEYVSLMLDAGMKGLLM
jgi:hypothetical protein